MVVVVVGVGLAVVVDLMLLVSFRGGHGVQIGCNGLRRTGWAMKERNEIIMQ